MSHVQAAPEAATDRTEGRNLATLALIFSRYSIGALAVIACAELAGVHAGGVVAGLSISGLAAIFIAITATQRCIEDAKKRAYQEGFLAGSLDEAAAVRRLTDQIIARRSAHSPADEVPDRTVG